MQLANFTKYGDMSSKASSLVVL